MPDIKSVADKADVIVNGYAFTRNAERIQVLNLNSPEKAVVFSTDGEVLETTMDDCNEQQEIRRVLPPNGSRNRLIQFSGYRKLCAN